MTDVPETAEGQFVLHDFRRIEWDRWRNFPERRRNRLTREIETTLGEVDNDPAGDSGFFWILGHKADILLIHFRSDPQELSAVERSLEQTALGEITEQVNSYVSVTEVSGYVSDDYFADDEEVDAGLERYINQKLNPSIPEESYVSFYPMSKRRGEDHNWYTLPFEARADMMAEHGDTGKNYAGKVQQVIASSVGMDDFEWGVTLFAEEPTTLKDIVYEMRFDEATAKYAEFGSFQFGRRFQPGDIGPLLAGESLSETNESPHGQSMHADTAHSHPSTSQEQTSPQADSDDAVDDERTPASTDEDISGELRDLGVLAGQPHGEDVYALILYSEATGESLLEVVDGLRENFDHYDTHVETAVYDTKDNARSAVVSLWETDRAARTAAGFLSDLPETIPAEDSDTFGTMGMFYTVQPDHREDFLETFDEVASALADIEGHIETQLLINVEADNEMLIASEWESEADATEFFRSETFRETVEWGREVLADRPRHVFMA